MRRTLLASAAAGAVIAVAWLNFESPLAAPARAAVVALLAIAVAVLPTRLLRAVGAALASLVTVRLAFGVWLPPHPASGGSIVWTRVDSGFADFYSTHLPFDPRVHVDMSELVLAAVFLFTLAVGLFAAARRPVAAALCLLAGAGWPATLIVPTHGVAIGGGAAILGAVLVVLAAAGSRRVSRLAVPVALVLVLGGTLVGAATASNRPAVPWQNWNLAGNGASESVRFVWNARYRGLHWPAVKTTMLDVRSTAEPGYVRAAVLDDFIDGRWVAGAPRAADSLEPAAALRPANQTEEQVTIEGLADRRLVGGSVPVRFAANTFLEEPERGFAELPSGFGRGFQYTAWSYNPRPSGLALSRSPARYPAKLLEGGMLEIGGGVSVAPFGIPGRERAALALVRADGLTDYVPLARLAARITRGAKTPYAAVRDLEHWFLVGGRFRYSDDPPVVGQPLVGFVTVTRSGYCQFFAGAMALMLRYEGIPARVAVGFAGPTYDSGQGAWTFTDHDAHAWVEVWFKGYGWIAFDPTPAAAASSRGHLIAPYKATGGDGSSTPPATSGGETSTTPSATTTTPSPPSSPHLGHAKGGGSSAAPSGGGSFPYWTIVAMLLAAVVGAIALAKEARRRLRRRSRDPRQIAAACRDELVAFLLDQGIEPPASATLSELGVLAKRALGADVEEFVAATTAARYGRPETAADAARRARAESGPLLASCRRFLSRRDRVRGLLSLRSLAGLRWTVDDSVSLGTRAS